MLLQKHIEKKEMIYSRYELKRKTTIIIFLFVNTHTATPDVNVGKFSVDVFCGRFHAFVSKV